MTLIKCLLASALVSAVAMPAMSWSPLPSTPERDKYREEKYRDCRTSIDGCLPAPKPTPKATPTPKPKPTVKPVRK